MSDMASGLAHPSRKRVVGLVGMEVRGEDWELPRLDLQEETDYEKVEAEVARKVDQGKKRKKKMEELLRRRRAPHCGNEGEKSD